MARVPLGIVILAVLNLLVGVLLLVGGGLLAPEFSWMILSSILDPLPNARLLIALIYILLGIGLLTLSSWAWWLDMIFAIINLIILLLTFPHIALIPFIVNLIIVLYLNQGSIRRKFNV